MSIRRKAWIIAGRILLGFFATLILFALLLKIFCTEENWRGRRALARCERELRARGEELFDYRRWVHGWPAPFGGAHRTAEQPAGCGGL